MFQTLSDWLREWRLGRFVFDVTFVSFSVQLNSPDEDLDVSRTAAVGSRQGEEQPFFF